MIRDLSNCSRSIDGVSATLKSHLEDVLDIRVRPSSDAEFADYHEDPSPADFVLEFTPLDPETGEVGVVVSIGQLTESQPGRLSAFVLVEQSGLSCVGFDVDVELTDGGWTIVQDEVTPDNPPKPYLICRLR